MNSTAVTAALAVFNAILAIVLLISAALFKDNSLLLIGIANLTGAVILTYNAIKERDE
jgi:hypothetical protein